ncbi:MAG: Hsp20/alpha crystallin family protein [Candidatus Pacearchaeota archaeon]
MAFFGEDPFEDIVREFFSESSSKRGGRREQFIRGEEEDRNIDYVEDDKKIYLVFELPGYDEKDVSVSVKGMDLEISAQKSNEENVIDYLNQKLRSGMYIKKELPNIINQKKFSHTMRNGVLEVIFDKSGRRK